MQAALHAIRKSKNSAISPEYTVTFLIDGTLRRFHAKVRVRDACAISFKEPSMDRLMMNNMDQCRKVYRAIFATHEGRTPRLPIALGDLQRPTTPQRFPAAQFAATPN